MQNIHCKIEKKTVQYCISPESPHVLLKRLYPTSHGRGPDYFWLKTAIFPVSVFLLLSSMKFGTELENYQYDNFK